METEKQITYRDYIQREFQARVRRNPSYSLRAFARDLGIQASKISEILRKKCGLSEGFAVEVAKKLRLNDVEAQHFVIMVESEHARSAVKREHAKELLKNFDKIHGYSELDIERFRIISDWCHNAILELTEVEDFQSDINWISHRLGLTAFAVEEAINRLVDFGLLTNDNGILKQTQAHLATPSGVPSREIREFHHQILKKATESIDNVSIKERDLSAMTIPIREDQIPLAKERIKEFRRLLAKELEERSPKQRVYNLSIQFFPLDKKGVTDEK